VALTRRAIGAASRRLGRAELLAAFYAADRQALREEIAIAAILASSLRSDSTYVDVGANRGQILREAVRLAPAGRHLAFEPIPSLAAGLARSFADVECRQLALGAEAQVAKFCHFRRLDGWSGLRRSPQISDERGDPEFITVNVSTLDSEIGELVPSIVKIDVEGSELDVIEGARRLLESVRPLLIIEHVAQASALYETPSTALWDRLAQLGYEVFSVTGDGPCTREAFARNATVVNWLARPTAIR
jgi:FkbM family methyltransferase